MVKCKPICDCASASKFIQKMETRLNAIGFRFKERRYKFRRDKYKIYYICLHGLDMCLCKTYGNRSASGPGKLIRGDNGERCFLSKSCRPGGA